MSKSQITNTESPNRKLAEQESQYDFPYHHLISVDNNFFIQYRNLHWGYEYISYLHFVINKMHKIEFTSLLDVGCGDGKFLREVRKVFHNKDLVGLDFSERVIAFAKAFNPDIKFVVGDITNTNSLKNKYDLITLIEVLEHIPMNKTKVVLKNIHKYLNFSGSLVVTVPSDNLKVSSKHFQHFSLEKLEKTLAPYFEVIDHFYLNNISRKTRVVDTILSNRFFLLNHQGLINFVYRYYTKKLLLAEKYNCGRIAVICKKIKNE